MLGLLLFFGFLFFVSGFTFLALDLRLLLPQRPFQEFPPLPQEKFFFGFG
jgi:hypothetical protein